MLISVAEADGAGGVTIERNRPAALAAFVLQRSRDQEGACAAAEARVAEGAEVAKLGGKDSKS